MRTISERRLFRKKAINHAKKLEQSLGTNSGSLYKKHIEKIEEQPGRYSKGSISHYVSTKLNVKSRGKNRKYGDRHISTRISVQEQKEIDKALEQEKEYYKTETM